METLQGKAFWRRKRAVLENQRVAIENRVEIASDLKKTKRSGATPVDVSATSV